jgi:hypothetical protein
VGQRVGLRLRRQGRAGTHERQRGRKRARREPDGPLSRLELLRGITEGGHEGRVALPEFLPGLLARCMAGRRRRLLGLIGAEVRLLPQDRLDSQRLDPLASGSARASASISSTSSAIRSRYCSGVRSAQQGSCESFSSSSSAYLRRPKSSPRFRAAYSAVRLNHNPLRGLPPRIDLAKWTPGAARARQCDAERPLRTAPDAIPPSPLGSGTTSAPEPTAWNAARTTVDAAPAASRTARPAFREASR